MDCNTASHKRTIGDLEKTSLGRNVWDLPEVLLYRIGQFVAPKTERAAFFCHQIAPLCKASYRSVLVEDNKSIGLWELVLKGDYGVRESRHRTRRTSKRLKRSPTEKVRDAHQLMIANTELAYNQLWELCYTTKKNALTRKKLIGIFNEFGPVMVNRIMLSGANFLVGVCCCRNTSQSNILNCVHELVEQRGAMVNLTTSESTSSSLNALCVASVRGMPKVVEYLLSKGAAPSTSIKCSGRFRLHSNPKRTFRCKDLTPLEFCRGMAAAEEEMGATQNDLRDLNRCIKLLQRS